MSQALWWGVDNLENKTDMAAAFVEILYNAVFLQMWLVELLLLLLEVSALYHRLSESEFLKVGL